MGQCSEPGLGTATTLDEYLLDGGFLDLLNCQPDFFCLCPGCSLLRGLRHDGRTRSNHGILPILVRQRPWSLQRGHGAVGGGRRQLQGLLLLDGGRGPAAAAPAVSQLLLLRQKLLLAAAAAGVAAGVLAEGGVGVWAVCAFDAQVVVVAVVQQFVLPD